MKKHLIFPLLLSLFVLACNQSTPKEASDVAKAQSSTEAQKASKTCDCQKVTNEPSNPGIVASEKECWQADVSVDSLTAVLRSNIITTSVSVSNDNDDDARSAKVKILLPINTDLVSLEQRNPKIVCVQDSSCVTCCLGNLPVNRATKYNIVLRSKIVESKNICNPCMEVSAFVSSDSPDPKHSNNFRYVQVGKCEKK
jgi:hypothetical protein